MTDEIDDRLDGHELDRANRDLVERFFAASERGDVEALSTMVDDRMVMSWPQSGERFVGRENVLGAMAAVEVKPQFAGSPRLIGSGRVWVLMVPLRYGADVLQYVAVLEVEDGRIRHATGYWGAPFPAQVARAAFVDPGGSAS
jgi:ketosteroid isomerase-like protein